MFGNVIPVLSAGNISQSRPEIVIVAANNFALPAFPSNYTFGAVILMSDVKQGDHVLNIWLQKKEAEETAVKKITLVNNQQFQSNEQSSTPGKSGVITVNFMNKTIPSEGAYILKTQIDDFDFNSCEIHFLKKSDMDE